MRQIGLAMQMYTTDFNDVLPPAYPPSYAPAYSMALQPYARSTRVWSMWRCPVDVKRHSGCSAYYTRSYAINIRISYTYGGNNNQTSYVKQKMIEDPSGTILVAERPNVVNCIDGISNSDIACPSAGNGPDTPCKPDSWGRDQANALDSDTPAVFYARPWHLDGFNYLFCDGHVEWLPPRKTVGNGTLGAPKGMWTPVKGD